MSVAIELKSKGDWKKTFKFLEAATDLVGISLLDRYGKMGVDALERATPKDTGVTANSWYYTIEETKGSTRIVWSNSSTTTTGIPIVVLLQYGHGTRQGGYVQGRDFINPAIQPVFDKIADDAWKEVTRK